MSAAAMIDQDAIIKEAIEFAETVLKPLSKGFEKAEGVSSEFIKLFAGKGYLGASIPVEYGGLGLNQTNFGLFMEAIGKACCATKSLVTVHTSLVSETILRCGSEAQRNAYLPKLVRGDHIGAFGLSEPLVGSDAKSVQTSFVQKDGKFVLNGQKKWITFGDYADLFIIIASRDGKPSAFIVHRDTPGFVSKRIKGLLAGRAIYLAELELKDVVVSEGDLLGKLDYGFEYVVSTALDNGRYSIAWSGVSTAAAALEAMVTYARTRSQFGEKLRGFQLIRGLIADSVTEMHSARALCLRAGELRDKKDPESILETTIAKYFCSKVAKSVVDDAMQIHGANGFTEDYEVERLYREARVLEIIEGSSQIQQEIIAMHGLRKYFKRK